jgi:copper(I)-binding protein
LTAVKRLVAGLGLTIAITLGTVGCGDGDTDAGLSVRGAWARPTPAGATAGAVYVTVVASTDDAIIAASVPDDVAADAQLHASAAATAGTGGESETMMTMGETMSIDLAAGTPFEFAPGATHIMLLDLAEPLTLGQQFTLELQLESGVSVPVDVVVADTAPTE